MLIDAKLLAADRALDQAWRGGVGVAKAVTHAKKFTASFRCDVMMKDATSIVSAHHSCTPDEALSRIVFVSQHTNRRLRDIAQGVIAAEAADAQALAVHPPRLYRFTL
jgi:phage-related minor tail protein